MTRKAVGLHIHSSDYNDAAREYIRVARPSVVKWLDDDGGSPLVAEAKAAGSLTVLRVYEQNQKLGAEGARYIGRVKAAMQRWPAFMVAEGYNEEFQSATEAARRAEFDIELMKAMDSIGRKAAIFSVSTGQPETAFWAAYLPALRYAADHNHYVAVHEYGGGPIGMKWGAGLNQWNGGHPGLGDPCTSNTTALRGWWCLRYRRAVDEWRRLGLTTIPRIIQTEGGLDDIWPRPGHGGKGYKDYIGEHPANVGDYAAQWQWLCERWAEDDYFVGGVDFGFATRDPQWSSFDMATDPTTLAQVTAAMQRLGASAPAPAPQPPPAPVPVPPAPTAPPFVAVEVQRSEGRLAVARRAYGLPAGTPMAAQKAAVARLEAANVGRTWGAGDWLRVPDRKVMP